MRRELFWGKCRYLALAVTGLLLFVGIFTMEGLLCTVNAAQESRKIRIGYTDYEGFLFEKKDGFFEGYGADYLEEISRYTGWEYEYVYGTEEELLANVRDGSIDFYCQAQRTAEREEKYLFSDYAIGTEPEVLYVKNEDERYYYNDFSGFDGMKIAVPQNDYHQKSLREYATEKGFSYQECPFASEKECFAALDAGSVDGVALGSLAPRTDYHIVCQYGESPFYFVTGKENGELMEKLNDALGEIAAVDPSFQSKLYQKFYVTVAEASNVAFTREEAEYIEKTDTVTVAFIPGREPLSYVDENGEIQGITVDIMRLLEERSGLDFEFVMMPVGMRAVNYMEEHPDSMIAGIMTENPQFKQEQYILSASFLSDDVALVCRRGEEYGLEDKDRQYRLAVPASYAALQSYIQDNYPQFTVITCNTMAECLQLVLDGEADFAAQNVRVLEARLGNPHYDKLTIVSAVFMQETSGIVGLNTEENRIRTSILNKCISSITDQEIAQMTIRHTISTEYDMTLGDVLYKFRYFFFTILFLLTLVAGTTFAYILMRRRAMCQLREKNVLLAEAVAQADSASQAKSRFLAQMSHELRTPMNAIVGLNELARLNKNEPEKVEECLDEMKTASGILLNLVNDVLDMSAIEADKIKLSQKEFNLEELMDSLRAVYESQCAQKGITFQMNVSGIWEKCLLGDELRLKQILLNLISNACKFTPEGGTITVTAEQEKTSGTYVLEGVKNTIGCRFIVTDTGEGMTEEMQTRLFLPFEQEDAGTARKHGGSGLGLSIAAGLAELMGGTIKCQSEKGKGTSFVVDIPFVMAAPEMKKKFPGSLTEERIMSVESRMSAVQQSGENMPVYDFSGKRILLAEDTRLSADIMIELLETVHLKVDHVENGRAALEQFAVSKPGTYDAILMDVQMPEMDGCEAARRIRGLSHPQAAEIPIFALSANAFKEDVEEALAAGMNGHLAKPVDMKLLYRVLWEVIGTGQTDKMQ